MNRIILIGNGFDKAHNLKTGYDDFIGWYWDKWGERLLASSKNCEEDKLLSFKLLKKPNVARWNQVAEYYFADFTISAHDFIEKTRKDGSLCEIEYKSELFSTICSSLKEAKWVDIEDEYFKQLCNDNEKPEKVNKELFFLRNKLIDYLRSMQDVAGADLIKKEIRNKMIEPFKKQDISISATDKWKYMFQERYNYQEREWMQVITSFLGFEKCLSLSDVESVYNEIADFINKNAVYFETNTFDYIDENGIPDGFLLPNRVMLLNFNYTNIADFYLPHGPHFYSYLVNHIHGELSKPESVIFGYGDEIDENYKRLLNKNDNEYLKNVKSINYLESSNYRNLLEFIESDTYQIYIMGHSCGNSDRTLLNTLFEHRNCVSIKPFYHKWDDVSDNYMELVQNISRNFTDMKLMRDRVVNKTFCETI